MKPIQCYQCDTRITQSHTGRPKKFCSRSCSETYRYSPRTKDRTSPHYTGPDPIAPKLDENGKMIVERCVNCEDVLPPPKSSNGRPRKYCSKRCKDRYLYREGSKAGAPSLAEIERAGQIMRQPAREMSSKTHDAAVEAVYDETITETDAQKARRRMRELAAEMEQ